MHKTRSIRKLGIGAVFLALIALGLSANNAIAQSTGSVKGKVRSPRGQAVSGVEVTARRDSADVKSVKSGSKGDFVMSGLEPGVYDFVFDAAGYNSAIRYKIEVRPGKTVDLGDKLVLVVDRGTLVIVQGSVFYKNGTSVTGAKVAVEKINSDGSTTDLPGLFTNVYGEFVFRQPAGHAKFRITAKYKDVSASKEIEVDSAAIYRLAISLSIDK